MDRQKQYHVKLLNRPKSHEIAFVGPRTGLQMAIPHLQLKYSLQFNS